MNLDRFSQGQVDPQDKPPLYICPKCETELYSADTLYEWDELYICRECATDKVADITLEHLIRLTGGRVGKVEEIVESGGG